MGTVDFSESTQLKLDGHLTKLNLSVKFSTVVFKAEIPTELAVTRRSGSTQVQVIFTSMFLGFTALLLDWYWSDLTRNA